MTGIPISNWLDRPHYKDATVCLKPGERFFLYTDGVTDQWLGDPDKLLSDNYIINILKDFHIDLTIALNLIGRYVYNRLDAMNVKQKDDITMALLQPVMKRTGSASKD